MNIRTNADIPLEKRTRYLLVQRPWDDKSKFLLPAGFDETNAEMLLQAIRNHAASHEAVTDGDNEYGEFFRVEGDLLGPNEIILLVVTIWIRWHLDGSMHFVTLKPLRKNKP